jgi:HEAT repeat protein
MWKGIAMNRSIAVGIVVLSCVALCCAEQVVGDQPGAQGTTDNRESESEASANNTQFEGRTIQEWIRDWDENNFFKSQKAVTALAAIGEPAVDDLIQLVKQRHRHSNMAIQTLDKMGDKAKNALPTLLELAADERATNPEGWRSNLPLRAVLFSHARNMSWAADQWVPVLVRVATNASEPEAVRQTAIRALGHMGGAAEPTLKTLASDEDREIRATSIFALADAAAASGRPEAEVFDEIIARNPFDPNMAAYLTHMKRSVNNGRIHPPTQQVKQSLRERLAAQPDPELAWTLANIIRNGLWCTDLLFDAPSDGGRTQQDREDPAENYVTLADALEIGLKASPPDSELVSRFGLSLARLRLLQGDWAGMNAVLERAGQPPMDEDLRPMLPAPPPDWRNLSKDWQLADESMRSGNCAIEFQFEKDGKGLAGAHVLVKKPRDPRLNAYTGIRVDTLLHATQPVDDDRSRSVHYVFGYHADDRAMTRYAVSDATGKVRIAHLPNIPVLIEVLIPTSNFPEPGVNWDLLIEVAPGEMRPTSWEDAGTVRSKKEGPTIVELINNEVIRYPEFIVRSQLALNVAEWSSVDPDNFVLKWQSLDGPTSPVDRYEVEMMLTAPSQIPHMISQQRVIQSTTETVRETRWDVGSNGVGGRRLRPGNIYMFEVRAFDAQGKVLVRLPRTRVWVPWEDRASSPPAHDVGSINVVPIHDRVWWQGTATRLGSPPIKLRDAVAAYLEANPNAFEYEYVLLGQAWLNCLDGLAAADRVVLEHLAQELPQGNIVHGTARSLLKLLDSGEPLPKRLEFVADE